MLPKISAFALLCGLFCALFAHDHGQRKIVFPDVPGYYTLKCDFHQHTVFSDGNVWPNIRVQEGLRDGLDAISVTDHIEYQPHLADIPHPDRNRSYEIAAKAAEGTELLVVRGAEITRGMPPGHCNAIFVEDVNKLMVEDPMEAFREAKKQGAFTFWNHPNWIAHRSDGIATLTDMHRTLIAEGLINGIEVVNEDTYSEEALRIGLDNNLTLMGTSDIHGLIDWDYNVPAGGHRPVTLVFAKERTFEAIREGLLAGRTVVWFNNTLVGREAYLKPLLVSSLSVSAGKALTNRDGATTVFEFEIENSSDADLIVENLSDFTLHQHANILVFPAHEKTRIQIKPRERKAVFQMKLTVLNAITAPDQHPELVLDLRLGE